jgi:hypothetical protein
MDAKAAAKLYAGVGMIPIPFKMALPLTIGGFPFISVLRQKVIPKII